MIKCSLKAVESEAGYALVMAIMILAILMVAGLMSSNTSITDIGIARNTIIHSQNTSAAESAAMTAVQALENQTDEEQLKPSYKPDDWINADPNDSNASSSDKIEKWAYAAINMTTKRRGSDNPRYRVVGWRIAQGTSLGLHGPTLREGRVIGEYVSDIYGLYRIELGYKKRF